MLANLLAKSKILCIIMGKILGPCVYVKVLEIQNFKSFLILSLFLQSFSTITIPIFEDGI